MSWYKIGIEFRLDYGDGIRSTGKFFCHPGRPEGWVIVVFPYLNSYEKSLKKDVDGNEIRAWNFHVPCQCINRRDVLRKSEIWIPANKNRAIIGCTTCNQELVHVSGLASQEWDMVISEYIYKDMR